MKYYSVSALSLYNECEGRYDLKYNDKIDPPEESTKAKERGSCFHAGIEWALRGYVEIEKGAKSTILIAAANGVMHYAKKNNVADDIRDEALEMVLFYVPLLGIGKAFKPLVHKGQVMAEVPFMGILDGVGFKGFIDAIVILPDGKLAILDWKTRDGGHNFYSADDLALDRQLFFYAAVAEKMLGLKISVISQIQMNATPPAVPKLKKGCDGTKADDYSLTIAKTTAETIKRTLKHLPADELDQALMMYADKIKPESYFLRSTRLDISLVPKMYRMTLELARRIDATTDFLPNLNNYQCRGCRWADACRAKYLGMERV